MQGLPYIRVIEVGRGSSGIRAGGIHAHLLSRTQQGLGDMGGSGSGLHCPADRNVGVCGVVMGVVPDATPA